MAAPSTKLTSAVGYARRSTGMQERSIPDQQAYVEKWAKEHGYEIARWFIDDAISGIRAAATNIASTPVRATIAMARGSADSSTSPVFHSTHSSWRPSGR